MRTKEQQLWDTMKRRAPRDLWMQRIENLVGEGMPDVLVSGKGWSCWIELKAPCNPAKPSTRLLGRKGLNPHQINWHLKAAEKALPTFVLIRCASTGELFLIDGKWAAGINEWPVSALREKNLASSWPEIFARLPRVNGRFHC